MRKQKSSTTSAKGIYNNLGIDGGQRSSTKKKKELTRKELRKQDRDAKKSSRQPRQNLQVASIAEQAPKGGKGVESIARKDGPLLSTLKKKREAEARNEVPSKKMKAESEQQETRKDPAFATVDPYIDAENKEIARLEKLMGIKGGKVGGKRKSAAKLNKEYELYEGIGSNFGDFLMDLDDLTEMIEGRGSKKQIFAGDSDNDSDAPDEVKAVSHLIDDDEQEKSDLEDEIDDGSDSDDDGGNTDLGSGDDDDEEDEGVDFDMDEEDTGEEKGDNMVDNEDGSADGENETADWNEEEGDENNEGDEEEDDEEGDEDEDGDDNEGQIDSASHTYQPSKGEDIYGRMTADAVTESATGGKYVPPARRAQLLATIDETSEKVKLMRRQMNGLMNRLSDLSKDSVVRAVKGLFDANSLSVANTVLRDCVMAACSNSSQLMTSLIPIYAAMIAALHLAVGADVGAFIIESLATSLHKEIEKEREILQSESGGSGTDHKYITSKLSNNALLLLVYLYNLRVLHHTLIVDLMTLLAGSFQSTPSSSAPSQTSVKDTGKGLSGPLVGVAIGELEVELLVCLVDHCGAQLRADDPIGLKTAITTLTRRSAVQSDAQNAAGSTRLRFMLEALTDLRNNKSRRIQSANADVVKGLRHWLGTVKNSLGGGRAGIDLCLRVSLTDLLDAEKTGRWWKAGASWAGKKQGGIITSAGDDSEGEEREPVKKQSGNPEEEKLLVLAQKMRFNTATRRNIFVVIMSSRDVDDAFERLQRLELKGKQDREVVRVISECCAQERSYNAFYSELAAMLCSYNRQYKTSIQFIFWDNFKLFEDEVAGRRTVNLARLLAHLVGGFHLPLAVLKPIDMTDLNANMMLFLATFFMALFSAKISEETFQTVLDRVATTKDFSGVRDNILFFLQSHLQKIPAGLDPAETKAMERRRKVTVKTMEAMSVLDIAAGAMEQEETESMSAAAEKRSKRSL